MQIRENLEEKSNILNLEGKSAETLSVIVILHSPNIRDLAFRIVLRLKIEERIRFSLN